MTIRKYATGGSLSVDPELTAQAATEIPGSSSPEDVEDVEEDQGVEMGNDF